MPCGGDTIREAILRFVTDLLFYPTKTVFFFSRRLTTLRRGASRPRLRPFRVVGLKLIRKIRTFKNRSRGTALLARVFRNNFVTISRRRNGLTIFRLQLLPRRSLVIFQGTRNIRTITPSARPRMPYPILPNSKSMTLGIFFHVRKRTYARHTRRQDHRDKVRQSDSFKRLPLLLRQQSNFTRRFPRQRTGVNKCPNRHLTQKNHPNIFPFNRYKITRTRLLHNPTTTSTSNLARNHVTIVGRGFYAPSYTRHQFSGQVRVFP